MEKDIHFWCVTAVRGLVALLAGSAIVVVPDMARTILLLPVAVGVAIVGLAAYGILDSTLIFISSFMASTRAARLALRIQGAIGVTIGTLLLSAVFDSVRVEWFLTLAALQALSLSVGEFMVAHHEKLRAVSVWNYTGSAIALFFACTYLIVRIRYAGQLTHSDISWMMYAYLVALGIAQAVTSARMVYADYHPATESTRERALESVPPTHARHSAAAH